MADSERDVSISLDIDTSAAQEQSSADYEDPQIRVLPPRTQSASISLPWSSKDSDQNQTYLVDYTGPSRSERKTRFSTVSGPIYGAPRPESLSHKNRGGEGRREVELTTQKFPSFSMKDPNDWPEGSNADRNEYFLMSGQLDMCNDPYCRTCPTYYHYDEAKRKTSKSSGEFDSLHNALFEDADGWASDAKVVQLWNKFFVVPCLVAFFIDPLFFFLLGVQSDNKCIVLNGTMTTMIGVFRCVTDFMYILHILLQFRLAYIAPELRVVGAGDLVNNPKEIALHYLQGYFFIDLFIAIPFPQIMILLILPQFKGSSAANYTENLLIAAVLVQSIPRLYRFFTMLSGMSSIGFTFESGWANFNMNILAFVFCSHVIGSCWYLFGLQVGNILSIINFQVLSRFHCRLHFPSLSICNYFFSFSAYCWRMPNGALFLCSSDAFSGSINVFKMHATLSICAVNLNTKDSIVKRYVYSLFWGFQTLILPFLFGSAFDDSLQKQLSTLAGNQVPSYSIREVLFTMAIIGFGLSLFTSLIGNMQNFLQAIERRRLEKSLRRRDVELWMRHVHLPKELQRGVRQTERYNWAATRGIDGEMVLENLPKDLQRDIRRHQFGFMKKLRIFNPLDVLILDAIYEKLRHKMYIQGSKILSRGGLVKRLTFIVRGKLLSEGEDGIMGLGGGDVCGEELVEWCLGNSSPNEDGKRIRVPGQRLHSNRTVKCLTNVEAFALRATDLEEVMRHFARFFQNPQVQGAIRYLSPSWRSFAATGIQVAWRNRKKCKTRDTNSRSLHSTK
ncbi:probable cyclic nucleotide-gated ion channel 20, chloroplastic [Punica granatum]|uniref:Probable cyclic nucleotide-gated ion channel 20, chloroplastic n=2 Tax=Punica granatum TaxID=22663 RepID=A0A6P8EBN0_PUNGR|nr:probable cyclic nucleotide-gated ion channel 20, chloroplastic [Punica granatum]